MLSPKGQVHEI